MSLCPCGSGKPYAECCEPYLSGAASAPSAEAVMRARYTAYVKQDIEYLENSLTAEQRADFSRAETRKWAENSEWHGLEIVQVEGGGATDSEGIVQFSAKFASGGQEHVHNEIAKFAKVDGHWLYAGYIVPEGKTVRRETPKIGRNDPCPCGSGKKYKKCCGAS